MNSAGRSKGELRLIRVMVAEDVRMVREALVTLLELEPDLEVVAQTGDGHEVVSLITAHRPDIAVVDIGLPGVDGLAASALARKEVPDCRVLLLTNLTHPTVLKRALADDLDGLLLKEAPSSDLAAAVRKVASGQRVFDPQLVLRIGSLQSGPLTAREVEILRLTAEGEEVTQIAEELNLSVGTVRNYLTSLVTKLSARNRIDALRIARDSGII